MSTNPVIHFSKNSEDPQLIPKYKPSIAPSTSRKHVFGLQGETTRPIYLSSGFQRFLSRLRIPDIDLYAIILHRYWKKTTNVVGLTTIRRHSFISLGVLTLYLPLDTCFSALDHTLSVYATECTHPIRSTFSMNRRSITVFITFCSDIGFLRRVTAVLSRVTS